VSQVIEEMSQLSSQQQPKNANSIHVHLAKNVSVMKADITKVRKSYFNLLSNACKFTGSWHHSP